jgi:hypothetical protein
MTSTIGKKKENGNKDGIVGLKRSSDEILDGNLNNMQSPSKRQQYGSMTITVIKKEEKEIAIMVENGYPLKDYLKQVKNGFILGNKAVKAQDSLLSIYKQSISILPKNIWVITNDKNGDFNRFRDYAFLIKKYYDEATNIIDKKAINAIGERSLDANESLKFFEEINEDKLKVYSAIEDYSKVNMEDL